MDRDSLREKVVTTFRSLTMSEKKGVLLHKFDDDYRSFEGTSVPYRQLGFDSLVSLLQSMPDVVSFSRSHEGTRVHGVADQSTKHIADMISKQRDTKRKASNRRPYRMQNPVRSFHQAKQYSKTFQVESRAPPRYPPKRNGRQLVQSNFFRNSTSFLNKSTYVVPPRFQKQLSEKNEPIVETSRIEPKIQRTEPVSERIEPVSERIEPVSARTGAVLNKSEPMIRNTELTLKNLEICQEDCSIAPPVPPIRQPIPSSAVPEISQSNIKSPKLRAEKKSPNHSPLAYSVHMSSKAFIEKYASENNLELKYKTSKIGQKRKNFISVLTLGGKTYQTYPEDFSTAEKAEEIAATKAREDIKRQALTETLPETTINSVEDTMELAKRIEEMVAERPNGIWSSAILKEYEKKFNESLPETWLDVTKEYLPSHIEIDTPDRINKDECILRVLKSSGTASPASSSSLVSHGSEDVPPSEVEHVESKSPLDNATYLNQWPVHVTSVKSTVDISTKIVDDAFCSFCDELDQFYKQNFLSVGKPIKNKLYVTHLEGENSRVYFRVRIEDTSSDSDEVTCYFVDVGNSKVLKPKDIQELDLRFKNYPFQAMTVKLHELIEYEHVIESEHLRIHLFDKTLIAELINRDEDGVAIVNLYDTSGDEDINVNKLLHDLTITECLSTRLPDVGSSAMARLVHVTSTGELYLRMSNPLDDYIQTELEKLTPTFEERKPKTAIDASVLDPDELFVAKYEDDQWYRAVIVGITDETPTEVEVFFVDYGNTSWVSTTNLCQLEQNSLLIGLLYQALGCSLSEVPPPKMAWTEEATKKLYDLLPDYQEVIVRVYDSGEASKKMPTVGLYIRDEKSAIVSINLSLAFCPDLFKPKENDFHLLSKATARPNELLLAAESANNGFSSSSFNAHSSQKKMRPSDSVEFPTPDAGLLEPNDCVLSYPDIPDSGFFDVFVTQVANPFNFIVQPINTVSALRLLQEEMQQFYSSEENACDMHACLLREGVFCVVLHNDGMWYRARVENVTEEPVIATVHFVDYGDFNQVPLNNIQPLYRRFQQLPCQAIKARLSGIRPQLNDWSFDDCVAFRELVQDKSFVSQVIKKDAKPGHECLHLYLIDTSLPNLDVYIHKTLISDNVARLI